MWLWAWLYVWGWGLVAAQTDGGDVAQCGQVGDGVTEAYASLGAPKSGELISNYDNFNVKAMAGANQSYRLNLVRKGRKKGKG